MELVSIITPAYKAARFIAATIESVRAQTYSSWEMLIVDDVSPDNTAEIAGEYARNDPRVMLIRHERNGGPAMARNSALARARGRYIAFLDSDDLWLPQKLQAQLDFMQAAGAALSFTQFRRIDESGTACGRLIEVPRLLNYADVLKNTAIATSTVVLDRSRTGPVRMTKTYYDDYVLWLELTRKGFAAHGLQEDLMRYRVVGKSVSRNKFRSAKWVWHTYREVERLSLPYALWCFAHYSWRAFHKYRNF